MRLIRIFLSLLVNSSPEKGTNTWKVLNETNNKYYTECFTVTVKEFCNETETYR